MKRFLLYSVLALGLVGGSSAGGSPLAAQELPRQELPCAEDILDREAEAVGGQEAYQKVKTAFTKMRISSQDMQVGYVVYHAGPDKHYQEFSSDGLSKTEVVVSGDVAWVKDSIIGCRILKGEERAGAFRDAANFAMGYQRVGNWRKQYKEVKAVAEEKVDGKPACKVHLTTQMGEVVVAYYDKQSGLLVRQEQTVEAPQGKVNIIQFFSDYRKVDGMVLPFRARVVRGSAEVVVTVEQIDHNVDIPAERFALPAVLKKLQKQQ